MDGRQGQIPVRHILYGLCAQAPSVRACSLGHLLAKFAWSPYRICRTGICPWLCIEKMKETDGYVGVDD